MGDLIHWSSPYINSFLTGISDYSSNNKALNLGIVDFSLVLFWETLLHVDSHRRHLLLVVGEERQVINTRLSNLNVVIL